MVSRIVVAICALLGSVALVVAPPNGTASAHDGCSSGPAYGNGSYSYCSPGGWTLQHRAKIWCRNSFGFVVVRYGQWTYPGQHSYAFCTAPYYRTNWGHQHYG